MKKMTAMLCLLAVLLGALCLTAMAEGEDAPAVSARVQWGDMNFVYHYAQVWNPRTHSYEADPNSASGWNHTTAVIVVENTSECAIEAFVTFEKSGSPVLAEMEMTLDRQSAVIPGTASGENTAEFVMTISGAPMGSLEGECFGNMSVSFRGIPQDAEAPEEAPEAQRISETALTVCAAESAVAVAEDGSRIGVTVLDGAGMLLPPEAYTICCTLRGDVGDVLLTVNSDNSVTVLPADPARSFTAVLEIAAEHDGSRGMCSVALTYTAPEAEAEMEPEAEAEIAAEPDVEIEAEAEPEAGIVPEEEIVPEADEAFCAEAEELI